MSAEPTPLTPDQFALELHNGMRRIADNFREQGCGEDEQAMYDSAIVGLIVRSYADAVESLSATIAARDADCAALRKALQKHAVIERYMTVDDDTVHEGTHCYECEQDWGPVDSERHAPTCILAQEKETQT